MAPDRVNDRRPQGGFTLIEVMVAILLTALTVIGVLGLFRIESRASQFSRRETEAAVLAQDKLEELRTGAPPSGVSSGSDGNGTSNPNNPVMTDQLSGTALFKRTWQVDTTTDTAVYKITVRVEWDDDGVTRFVQVVGQRGAS